MSSSDAVAIGYHADSYGWRLVSDGWAASWSATVNRVATEVMRAVPLCRTVKVAPCDDTIIL